MLLHHFIYINQMDPILFSNDDSRPSFNCQDYIIDTVFQTTELDTFYIQKNENNKNIFVNIILKMEKIMNL